MIIIDYILKKKILSINILTWICIFVILFMIGCYIKTDHFENFSRTRFLNKKETQMFFKLDEDKYISKLTPYDINAQQSLTKDEYKFNISISADSFTPIEKNRLIIACKKADLALKKINEPGFDGHKASDLPWNIALTRGKKYENGYPHTRLDTIFLSDRALNTSDFQLAKTMLHEKVHIYERKYPKDIDVWMNSAGYKKDKRWDEYKNARSNPDINDWSYLGPDGKPMVVLYNKDKPKSIADVDYPVYDDPASEHPYEALAYMLEKYLK